MKYIFNGITSGWTLYHDGVDGIWRRAIHQFKKPTILRGAHCGIAGGHYAKETTT